MSIINYTTIGPWYYFKHKNHSYTVSLYAAHQVSIQQFVFLHIAIDLWDDDVLHALRDLGKVIYRDSNLRLVPPALAV